MVACKLHVNCNKIAMSVYKIHVKQNIRTINHSKNTSVFIFDFGFDLTFWLNYADLDCDFQIDFDVDFGFEFDMNCGFDFQDLNNNKDTLINNPGERTIEIKAEEV